MDPLSNCLILSSFLLYTYACGHCLCKEDNPTHKSLILETKKSKRNKYLQVMYRHHFLSFNLYINLFWMHILYDGQILQLMIRGKKQLNLIKQKEQEVLTITTFWSFSSTFCFDPWLATTTPSTHTDAPVVIKPDSTCQQTPNLK